SVGNRVTRLLLISLIACGGCASSRATGSVSQSNTAVDRAQSSLFRAAESGSKEGVRYALDQGADINRKESTTGRSALHMAAVNGQKELVALLLSLGADVNAQDGNGDTPLHLAAAVNHDKTVLALLGGSPDRTIRNNKGKTAADVAAPGLVPLVEDRGGK